MLSNLIGNAVQYGSVGAPVKVAVGEDAGDIVISVNNLGPAIPPEKLPCIFDPLVRIAASTSSDDAERTSLGIGLFISREIVKAHGGTMCVESNGERGTTFTVTMPRGLAAERQRRALDKPRAPG